MKSATGPAAYDVPLQPVIDGLTAVGHVMVAIAARSLDQADHAVTMPQFRVMTMLQRAPRRVADIATELGVQSSTATRMCDRLVAKDLICREEHLDDRRVTWTTLTPTGRDFIDAVLAYRHEAITALVEAVTERVTPQTAALLYAIADAGGHPVPGTDPLTLAILRTGARP